MRIGRLTESQVSLVIAPLGTIALALATSSKYPIEKTRIDEIGIANK